MLDSLSRGNARDFRARYLGTFGFYTTTTGKRLLVKMTHVDESATRFVDRDGMEYRALADTGINFEFLQVDRGWFNTPTEAVHMSRIPARQWLRGIASTNTSLQRIMLGKLSKAALDFAQLSAIYEQEKPSLPEMLESMYKGTRPSVALSKHFALTKTALFLYNIRVGDISGKKLTITEPVFTQEINDINNRAKLEMTIQ